MLKTFPGRTRWHIVSITTPLTRHETYHVTEDNIRSTSEANRPAYDCNTFTWSLQEISKTHERLEYSYCLPGDCDVAVIHRDTRSQSNDAADVKYHCSWTGHTSQCVPQSSFDWRICGVVIGQAVDPDNLPFATSTCPPSGLDQDQSLMGNFRYSPPTFSTRECKLP